MNQAVYIVLDLEAPGRDVIFAVCADRETAEARLKELRNSTQPDRRAEVLRMPVIMPEE